MADSPEEREARRARIRDEIREGLAGGQKEIPPKYFYDARGSELFEVITHLPEYYPTRTERYLLETRVAGWVEALGPGSLVELGAGSARKTRTILDAILGARESALYVPVDVSSDFLQETAAGLRAEYPPLRVEPVVADFSRGFSPPDGLPRPALFALLGSTVGNFGREEAVAILRRIREAMVAGDRLLMGFDLGAGEKKPGERIEAAYNDSEGVTAAFNRNALRVLNRELGADFDPDAFRHRAFYDPEERRVEMHLVSPEEQVVEIPGIGAVHFDAGESIRTEISRKYDRERVEDYFAEADLGVEEWWTDPEELFALAAAAPRAGGAG